jgi:hypothetical protein
VQGTDYAYTLQGWLKGINGDRLNPTTDMGGLPDPGTGQLELSRAIATPAGAL